MEQSVLFDAPGPRTRRTINISNAFSLVVVVGLLAVVTVQLGRQGQLSWDKWGPALDGQAWLNFYLPGLGNTLKAAALGIAGALVFGLLFGVGRLWENSAVRWFSAVVVEFFRAVPVLIMMIFFYNVFARSGASDAPLWAVVVALILYNGSVVAELVRSGVHGLAKGQREAGIAVGLTRGQCLRLIEVPQALVAMLPALMSQLVVVLKDSALGAIILFPELLQLSRQLGSGWSNILQTLFVCALIYIIINGALTALAHNVTARMQKRTAPPPPEVTAVVLAGTDQPSMTGVDDIPSITAVPAPGSTIGQFTKEEDRLLASRRPDGGEWGLPSREASDRPPE